MPTKFGPFGREDHGNNKNTRIDWLSFELGTHHTRHLCSEMDDCFATNAMAPIRGVGSDFGESRVLGRQLSRQDLRH